MDIEIVSVNNKTLARFSNLKKSTTILDIKKEFAKKKEVFYVDRQSYRIEPRGKSLKDDATLESLGIESGGRLVFKDLGAQIGWRTVFLIEYSGPLFVYLIFYLRPDIIYGYGASELPVNRAVKISAACWAFHYVKRLFETVFVHRFSHGTMPMRNLFKNCSYYWGFAAYVSYYINHPLYTAPFLGSLQLYGGLVFFILCELGNYSIHAALRDLRPEGTKERKIPLATSNPFTALFKFVSCPNYTYEVGAWAAFTVMTQCLAAGLFTAAGFYQMTVWALAKHRAYKKEFQNYPKRRKSIIPFII